MNKLDKFARDALKNIYTQLDDKDEISVSSPNYKKTVIDYLVNEGLLEKLDASTLSGWTYIVRPTHRGEMLFSEILNSPISKVESFIKQGEVIMKEEYHKASPGFAMLGYISGPKSEQWFNEINIFNSRFLKDHPLYEKIADICNTHGHMYNPHEKMMGYLQALIVDDEFWQEIEPKEITMKKPSKEYDVFISHANADKEGYVNQLKNSLDKLKISIFYDKDTLEWGDVWKDKILEGVDKAEFAIIVISDKFFGREWTEKELNEFLNRQNTSGQKIILPILHNITIDQLKEKYPAVADIQALNSVDYSCDEIALKFAGQLIKRLKS